jgi:hypothetical protein
MKSLTLARQAMNLIVQHVPVQTLNRTSYCAVVVKLASGTRAVVVAEAGATASGIGGPLVDLLDNGLQVPIIPCANPTPGLGFWHMNDAEQQAIQTIQAATGTLQGARIKAVVANRDICPSCTHMLQTMGMIVNNNEAEAP